MEGERKPYNGRRKVVEEKLENIYWLWVLEKRGVGVGVEILAEVWE